MVDMPSATLILNPAIVVLMEVIVEIAMIIVIVMGVSILKKNQTINIQRRLGGIGQMVNK